MQALKILQICLTLLPAIIDIIRKIEGLFPECDQGAKKLAMTKEVLEATFKSAGDVGVTFEKVWPVIGLGVKTLVRTFNATGVFKSEEAPKSPME